MNEKIAIIGSGALGSAFANVLIDAGCSNVLIYGIDKNELKDLQNGENTKYFGDQVELHHMKTTNNLEEAIKDAKYIVLAIPSQLMDIVLTDILKFVNVETMFINGCKGFYPNSELSLHTGIDNKIKTNKLVRGCVSLSGPSFAREIAKKSLTTIAAFSDNLEHTKEIQKMFYTSYFKLYIQEDVIGSEVGGLYKNIIAIGSGMLLQKGFKINTIASYLTRGMKEIATFCEFAGGKKETVYGLTGLGDLILTSTDANSRNLTFGKNFVKNPKLALSSKVTTEGVTALKIVEKMRKDNNLNLPIAQMLYDIIFNEKDIQEAIQELWVRDLSKEE